VLHNEGIRWGIQVGDSLGSFESSVVAYIMSGHSTRSSIDCINSLCRLSSVAFCYLSWWPHWEFLRLCSSACDLWGPQRNWLGREM